VVCAFEIPDYTFEKPEGMRYFFMEVAFPVINYTHHIPMMLTSVLGNVSMMGNLKLMDLEFPKSWIEHSPGPSSGRTAFARC
jgi:Ribulose 1,5-bisphosphate carboxylase, large subunit